MTGHVWRSNHLVACLFTNESTFLMSPPFSVIPLQARWQRVCNFSGGPDVFRLDYDPHSATLNLTLKNQTTHVASYSVQLLANSSVADLERVECHGKRSLLPHSALELTAQNAFAAQLAHVYTGLYRMQIISWFGNGSHPSIQMEFVAQSARVPVAVQNWTTRFIIHPLPRTSTIIVQFEPAAPDYEFQHYEVSLFATELNDCHYIYSDKVFICYANQTRPECTFQHLTSGSYCAQIRPLDHRCALGLVWQVLDNCIVHSDIIQLDSIERRPESAQSIFKANQSNVAAVVVGIVLTLSIVMALVIVAIIWICKRSSPATKNFIPLQRSASDSPQPKSTERSGTVLLLRMTDVEQALHQSIQQLKQQLLDHCNAEILDMYEESLCEAITIDPVGWMNRITAIKDLRVIVVDTPRLRRQLDCPTGDLSHMEQLVLYLTRQMWTSQATGHRQTLYNSVFLVRLTDDTNPHGQLPLTPFRSFHFPAHTTDLLFYLNLND